MYVEGKLDLKSGIGIYSVVERHHFVLMTVIATLLAGSFPKGYFHSDCESDSNQKQIHRQFNSALLLAPCSVSSLLSSQRRTESAFLCTVYTSKILDTPSNIPQASQNTSRGLGT